jgi:hypothetical protein
MSEYDKEYGPLLTPTQRQYIDHRTGITSTGFATSDGNPPDIEGRKRQVKSQINNERAVSSHFGAVIRAFANDIQRIEKFYNRPDQTSDDFYHLLWANKEAIKTLDFVTERLNALADGRDETWNNRMDAFSKRQIQLQAILSPVYNGLENFENPEQEFDERIKGLKTICEKELTDLLNYIMTTSEQDQMSNESKLKKQKDGWTWQQYATRDLEKDHGLVSGEQVFQNRKKFTPTERGKVIFEALEPLLESEYIEQWQDDNESKEKAAFKALSQPYPDI